MTQSAVAPSQSTPFLPLLLVLSLPLLTNILHGSLLPCVGAAPKVGGTPWATPALEALDEQHDAEILQSVISSMAQWQQRHTHKKFQREKRASESVVCYESVGCFRDAGPFSYLDMLPSPPEEVSTQFLLYSRHRPHSPALLVPFSNFTSVTYSTTSSFSSVSSASSNSEKTGYNRPVRDTPSKDPNTTTPKSPAAQKLPSFSTSFSSPTSSDLVSSTAFSPSDWLQAGLNVSTPTKVIVHGFGSSCSNIWVFEMRSALMSVEECNVICVDWEAGATIPNYVRAAANTRLVGKQLALLLGRLRDSLGLDLQRVHLIGFSLGAHVAGFAGAELQNLSRITGLDPAGPLFENQDPMVRLDSTDATFVDVIHSNGENLILGGLGSWQPMGHVDFYPNGGRMQKGCSNLFVGAVSDIFWSSSESHGRSLCNHRRAYKFFTDSVSPRCHFPAIPCESYEKFLEGDCFPCSSQNRCGNMGYYADRSNGHGTLYLITRDDEPFCAHQYLVKVESTPSALPVISYGRIQITVLGSVPEANETFVLTRKDDEELKAGGSLSRIIVPHPVLEEPIKVEVLYVAYSGWISSGLARWSIDKVTIGDSFGKSASFCNKGLILETNVPVMLPLYPGDCNPPIEAPTFSPSVPIPHPIPILPNGHLDTSSPSQDRWPQTANDNEVKSPNIADGSSSTNTQEGTRIPTQVVYVGDEGLDANKEETPEKNDDKGDEKKNDNKKPEVMEEWEKRKNLTKSEALTAGIGAGQEDPLLSPQIHSNNKGSSDETDSSWQPLTNDGSNNSLSPDGPGSREDGARAFIDPGEVTNNINKRNDSLQPSSKDSEGEKQNTQSKRSSGHTAVSHWRPRHIPIYSSSLYEPRGGWHPEMSPPELDPPPIHAPLTWQHWVGYDEDFIRAEREFPLSTSKNEDEMESTTVSTSTHELTSPPSPTNSTITTTEKSGGPFAPVVETVQLLPQRLAAFLARAEEYARVTLSGMVLGVGGGTSPMGSTSPMGNDSSEAARRKPKYFPPMSSGSTSASEGQTPSVNSPIRNNPKDGQTAPIAVPSQATSVSAMGRGLPQYYPRAIVGRGSDHSVDTNKGNSGANYPVRDKSSQETKVAQSGHFGDSEMSESILSDAALPVQMRKSEMSKAQSVVRPQRGITSVAERMLDVNVRGKGGAMQHWQKLGVSESHHQLRYIPLRRSSVSQESFHVLPRRNSPPAAFVLPRKR